MSENTALGSFQKALITLIKNRTTLMALLQGLGAYDAMFDPNVHMPYLVFMGAEEQDESPIGATLGSFQAWEIIEIRIYSDAPGRMESLTILGELKATLDNSMTFDHGIPASKPWVKGAKEQMDETIGLWYIPVDVRVFCSNI